MDSFVTTWRRRVRRRRVAGAALFSAVLALGAIVLVLARPIHRAEAKLKLSEPPPPGGVSPAGGVFGMLRLGGDAFANDLELLASRTLAEGVVDDAVLHVAFDAPRGWPRDSLVSSLSATRATRKASWTVQWLEDGAIEIRAETSSGDVMRAAPGVAVSFGGVTAVFRAHRGEMPRGIEVRTVSHAEATRVAGARILLERARRDANVVRIRYDGPDAGVAERAVSSVVTRFVALRTAIQRRESGETVDSLRIIAQRTLVELSRAEQALEQLQRTSGLVVPDAQSASAVEQYADVGARLELTRMELSALDAALTRAGADATSAWSSLLAYPRFLENEMLSRLVEQLTALEQQRRELGRRRTADNNELRAVAEQITYLEQSLRTLAADYRSALALQRTALDTQLRTLTARLGSVPAQLIELGRRQRDVRVLAEVGIMAEQRLRQEQLRQALTFANVQVIDPPALRDRPIWPRRKLGLLASLLLAGGTALVGMSVIDRADATVRRAADVRRLLDVPVLGVVRRDAGGAFPLTIAEIAAIVRRGSVDEPGRARVVIAAVDDAALAQLAADALDAGSGLERESGVVPLARPDATVLGVIDTYAAASVAATARAPIVLAIRAGVTRDASITHAAMLLAEAGAQVTGVIVVCGSAREVDEVWAA